MKQFRLSKNELLSVNYKWFIASWAAFQRNARSCDHQMFFNESTHTCIFSMPHIDYSSVWKLRSQLWRKKRNNSDFRKIGYFQIQAIYSEVSCIPEPLYRLLASCFNATHWLSNRMKTRTSNLTWKIKQFRFWKHQLYSVNYKRSIARWAAFQRGARSWDRKISWTKVLTRVLF